MSKKMYVHRIKTNRKMKDPHTRIRETMKKRLKKVKTKEILEIFRMTLMEYYNATKKYDSYEGIKKEEDEILIKIALIYATDNILKRLEKIKEINQS